MDSVATAAVAGITKYLASLHSSGKAGRIRGIIVSPEVYRALQERNDNFSGRLGVSGVIGSRKVRFEFYVLENPNFPSDRSTTPYFFVPYPLDVYTERFLGREREILEGEKRKVSIGSSVIEELNPVIGVLTVGNHYLYEVSFEEVVAKAQEAQTEGKDPSSEVIKAFWWGSTGHNKPETTWIQNPEVYDFHRADIVSSIGSMLMQRLVLDKNHIVYRIVGIAIDGFGRIVEIGVPDSVRYTGREFALFAHHYFVDEEVRDFLAQFGEEVSLEELAADPVSEDFRVWGDQEELGRLNKYVSLSSGDRPKTYSFSANFKSTRVPCLNLELARGLNEEEAQRLRANHFPADWKGWAQTRADRAMAAFAATL